MYRFRFKQHDVDDTLAEWAVAHGNAVRSLVARYEYSRDDADDIVSDVFQLAYRNMDSLSQASEVEVRSWLLRTARNLVANHVRRSMSRRRLLDRLAREPLPVAISPDEEYALGENQIIASTRSQRVRFVLAGLREDYRLVLIMDALGDSDATIAKALGVSPNAARKRLMRARIAFRSAFVDAVDRGVDSTEGTAHE